MYQYDWVILYIYIFICITHNYSVTTADSLWPHELQHARLLCPSLSPKVHSNSCSLSWWCYLTISSSAIFSSFGFNISQLRGLFHELGLHIRRPKYWSFSFSISPSNEYSGLISVRIDWSDLLAVQIYILKYHSIIYSSQQSYKVVLLFQFSQMGNKDSTWGCKIQALLIN